MQVEGAIRSDEYSDGWFVRLIYKCPLCKSRHHAKRRGEGSVPNFFSVECEKGFGIVEVIPYKQ